MDDLIYDISGVERDIVKFFKSLPPAYRERAVGHIFQKALIPMRDRIRSNAPQADKRITFVRRGSRYEYNPGNLKRSISIQYLRPRGKYQYPAARVYIKRRIQDGWYAHFLEDGTKMRTDKRTIGGAGANRGRIEGRFFFRRGADSTMAQIKSYTEMSLKKYGDKVMEQQLKRLGLKTRRIKMEVK